MQRAADQVPEFRALPAPTQGEVMSVAWETCQKTVAILRARGQWIDMDPNDDRFAQKEPGLAQCYASSIGCPEGGELATDMPREVQQFRPPSTRLA